ncbi:MAG: hypothetical protein ACK5LO_16675 [Leucobacter sp.]
MEIFNGILVVLLIVGFGLVFGGALAQLPAAKRGEGRVQPIVLWGVILLLVTGLALVGMMYALGGSPDNVKIAVKLVVLLALAGHVFGIRKKTGVAPAGFYVIAGLALLNALIAVLWT